MKIVLSAIVLAVIGTTTLPTPRHPGPGPHPQSTVERPVAGRSPRAAHRGAAEAENGISIVEPGTMVLASMGLLALGAAVRRRRR